MTMKFYIEHQRLLFTYLSIVHEKSKDSSVFCDFVFWASEIDHWVNHYLENTFFKFLKPEAIYAYKTFQAWGNLCLFWNLNSASDMSLSDSQDRTYDTLKPSNPM